MLKRTLIITAVLILIMVILPLCAVYLINDCAGMAVCFLLFFAVDPATSVILGVDAGKSIGTRWFQPLLTAVMFYVGTLIAFEAADEAFLLYSSAYLVLGYVSAVITMLILNRIKRNKIWST